MNYNMNHVTWAYDNVYESGEARIIIAPGGRRYMKTEKLRLVLQIRVYFHKGSV